MQEKEITHKGKRIFYRTIGEGPVVVLLHGVPFDGNVWSNQFYAFENYKLVIPDLPGSGRSEMIEDMSIDGMAACVKEIIVHEGSHPNLHPTEEGTADTQTAPVGGSRKGTVLIGHSMGGYITLALAEKYPELLTGFGLFHSTAYADSEEKKQGRKKTIETIQQNGVEEFIKNSVPNLFGAFTKTEKPEIIAEQIRASYNFSADAIVKYQMAMMQRPDRTGVLKNSTVPVLFVLGKYDTAVPVKDGLEQCSLADLTYIHVLENAGHMGMREEPNETNTILLNYLTNTCHQTQ